MTKFIWVRDEDKNEHYINVDRIIRATKVPARGTYSARSFVVVDDGGQSAKYIHLAEDTYDTYEEVIAKIQAAV
jgi:predicted GNAT superfamily acetyltransferase